jgi:transposase
VSGALGSKWPAEGKAAIVAESLAEGAVVSEVARRHGLSPQQVFGWRARLRDAVKDPAPSSNATPPFVPAIVEVEPPPPAAPALPAVVAMSTARVDPAPIEIALGGVIVRVRGEADPRALTTVLKAPAGARMIGPAISASGATQILVATKPVDFRNYAERAVRWTAHAAETKRVHLSTV